MDYEWYVDIFFLTNFLMDLAGLFTAAVCCNQKIRIWFTVVVCGASVLVSMLFLLYFPNYLLYRLLVHTVLNPLMTFLVFRPGDWGQFLRLLLSIYLVIFFMGGVQGSIRYQTGSDGNGQILISGMFAAFVFAVYMIRRKTLCYVCTVDLWLAGKRVTVSAYCDSGNLLRNPENGHPVSILERKILGQWDTGHLEVQRVPCHTISGDQAYLDVITFDEMDIYLKGTVKRIKAPEIGLHTGKLMQRPVVQMLLHASYMSG